AGNWIVRHGAMRFLGEFEPDMHLYQRGDEVVLRTDRGHELGTVLCRSTPEALAYLHEPTHGRILRPLNDADRLHRGRLAQLQSESMEACQRFVEHRKLQMELVDTEHLFGGERIIFYFLAEKRVDFRELVKDLARTFQTRIEMRQIGVRDEAKLLA